MKKELEDYLWQKVPFPQSMRGCLSVREVIQDMVSKGMIANSKQAHCTLQKWRSKGIYNYGCCLDLGWKEEKDKS